MKKFFVDTNVILRFLLEDNINLFNKAKNCFERAKNKEIDLHIIPEIFFEIDYVLRGVYKLSKKETSDTILKILLIPYLEIIDRNILIQSVKKYQNINIDFFDIYLYLKAQDQKGEIISFDRDFNKLEI